MILKKDNKQNCRIKIIQHATFNIEEKATTRKDAFDIVNMYFKSTDLSWKPCVGICTHGAHSMVGCLKGFVSYIKT